MKTAVPKPPSKDIKTASFAEQLHYYYKICEYSKPEDASTFLPDFLVHFDVGEYQHQKKRLKLILQNKTVPDLREAEALANALMLGDAQCYDEKRRGTKESFIKAAQAMQCVRPLGELLEAHAKEKGKKTEYAKKSGISLRTFHSIMQRGTCKDIHTLGKFLDLCDITPELRKEIFFYQTGMVENQSDLVDALTTGTITVQRALLNCLQFQHITTRELASQLGRPATTIQGWCDEIVPEYFDYKKVMKWPRLKITEPLKRCMISSAGYAVDMDHLLELHKTGKVDDGNALRIVINMQYNTEADFSRSLHLEPTRANHWVTGIQAMPRKYLELLTQKSPLPHKRFIYRLGKQFVDNHHIIEHFGKSNDVLAFLEGAKRLHCPTDVIVTKQILEGDKELTEAMVMRRLCLDFQSMCKLNGNAQELRQTFTKVCARYCSNQFEHHDEAQLQKQIATFLDKVTDPKFVKRYSAKNPLRKNDEKEPWKR